MSIIFQAQMVGFADVEAALGMTKDKSKYALRAAVNQTAKETLDLLVKGAEDRYVITRGTQVKKTLALKKATVRTLTATITSSGRVNELYSFEVKPSAYTPKRRPVAGHRGRVLKSSQGKYVYHTPGQQDQHKAFVVKYKSGHKTLAQRVPGTKARNTREGHPNEEAIKTLYSPSVPKMLGGEEGVFSLIKPDVERLLDQHINEQLTKYLSRAAKEAGAT